MNVLDPAKQLEIEHLWKRGQTIRSVMAETGVSKATVNTYFKLLRMKYGTVLCPCGQIAGHREWCSYRFSKSPRRQKYLSTTWITKNTQLRTIGLVWRPDPTEKLVTVNPCRAKGCVFPRKSGSSVCEFHLSGYSLSFSLTDASVDWRDLYSSQGEYDKGELSVTNPYDSNYFKVERKGVYLSEVLQADASASIQHPGAQIVWKGFGKRKIRKSQRRRAAGWHGPRPDHDVVKRWNRDSIDKLPQWAPPATIETEKSSHPTEIADVDELEREILIQQLVADQKEDMQSWLEQTK